MSNREAQLRYFLKRDQNILFSDCPSLGHSTLWISFLAFKMGIYLLFLSHFTQRAGKCLRRGKNLSFVLFAHACLTIAYQCAGWHQREPPPNRTYTTSVCRSLRSKLRVSREVEYLSVGDQKSGRSSDTLDQDRHVVVEWEVSWEGERKGCTCKMRRQQRQMTAALLLQSWFSPDFHFQEEGGRRWSSLCLPGAWGVCFKAQQLCQPKVLCTGN